MIYEFDGFTLDTAHVELRRMGEPVAMEPKNYELLRLLLENADRVVTKDEIFERIWPGVYVTEASVSGAIKLIRKAIGDDGVSQALIRTVRGRGFRFVADVTARDTRPAAVPASTEAGATPATSGPPVVAVLPFSLLATDDRHRAIAEAIPTELIATLSRLRSNKVIARGSSFRFGPDRIDLDEIRRQVGANYVLSGSVELTGSSLAVIPELTDTRSHGVIWSDSFSCPLDDIFAMRQTIVREVSMAIELRIPMNEADALSAVPSENLDAWGLYHLGVRHLYRFNGADNEKAGHYMRRAVELDPGFARAVAGLSYTEFENYNLGFGAEKDAHRARALDLAEQAVDLDPYDPFCNLVLGRAHWIHQSMDDAVSWVDRSIQLNPNYAFGHYNSGKFNALICDGDTSDAHIRSAMSLSPLDPHLQSMLSARAMAAFVRDDAEAALRFADRSLRAPNAHLYVCAIAAAIHASYGQDAQAHQALARIEGLGAAFDKAHFRSLFSLKDPDRNSLMFASIDRLGL